MSFRPLIFTGLTLLMTAALNGCALFSKEIKFEDIPPAAQASIQSHTSGGTIESITCEKEEGEHFYKVEYTKNGRKFELEVDGKGNIMETEEVLAITDLPPEVRDVINTNSAGGEIKELVLETEDGKVFYEVEFEKDGKAHEMKIAEDGTVLEHESE